MTEEFLTAQKMRNIERVAIDAGTVSGLTLMERAGAAVVREIYAKWPEQIGTQPGPVACVLCGPGNNGGDGFVVARLLHTQGWPVQVFMYGLAARLPPDAKTNHDRWIAIAPGQTTHLSFPGVTEAEAELFADAAYRNGAPSFVIDALFGIGLTRPLTGLTPVLRAIIANKAQPRTTLGPYHVSIDVPSGLAESGPIAPEQNLVFPADLTVTFHRKKVAHQHGSDHCGALVVADIGL